MGNPRLEIDLVKIRHNTRHLVSLLSSKGISLMGVTKAMLGEPRIARVMVEAGVEWIGDSRIENIRLMREAGVPSRLVLIRSPMKSQVDQVVAHADVSMNSEICILRRLSRVACDGKRTHGVMLMVELGDLREGVLPEDLPETIREVLQLPGLELIGLATNLGCISGVVPTAKKMDQLSAIALSMERQFSISLKIVSGGNSANYIWLTQSETVGRINHLRIGEMIFLGHDTVNYAPVPGLHTDAVTLVAEVIECKIKPSLPSGEIRFNAFGQAPSFRDRGQIRRAILALGRQDVSLDGLMPLEDVEVLGSSSDHVVMDVKQVPVEVGDEVRFKVAYGALLSAMTSPHVEKRLF